jgi:hypothetical protein
MMTLMQTTGGTSMALQGHLAELEKKHQILEREIAQALVHPSTDDLKLAELKRKKLHLKDTINKLAAHPEKSSVH